MFSHCSCFQTDAEWSAQGFSILSGWLVAGAGCVLILAVPSWSHHQGTKRSPFQGETEARGCGAGVRGLQIPHHLSLGWFIGGLGMFGWLYTWRKAGKGRLTPRNPLQASQVVFPPFPCASHSSQPCRAFCFPHRHISRSSCFSITGLSTSGLQGVGLVVVSVPVRMNER